MPAILSTQCRKPVVPPNLQAAREGRQCLNAYSRLACRYFVYSGSSDPSRNSDDLGQWWNDNPVTIAERELMCCSASGQKRIQIDRIAVTLMDQLHLPKAAGFLDASGDHQCIDGCRESGQNSNAGTPHFARNRHADLPQAADGDVRFGCRVRAVNGRLQL